MRKILAVVLVALLTGCAQDKSSSEELTDFIPESSVVILKLQDPDLFFSNLKNNEFLKKNNNHPLAESIKGQLSLLNYFPHKEPAFLTLSVSEENKLHFTFISREAPQIGIDSVQNKMVESFTTGNQIIKKYTLEDRVAFTGSLDNIYIFSNSRQLLENSLSKNAKIANSADFRKTMRAASVKQPAVFINHKKLTPLLKSWFPGENFGSVALFSNWTVVDADLSQAGIKLNGITTAGDSLSSQIDLFKGVGTSENLLAHVTPATARGFHSVSFGNFTILDRNLRLYRDKKIENRNPGEQELLETATETGLIYLENAEVFAIRTLDQEAARIALASHREETENFREIPFFDYPENNSFNFLQPLLSPKDLSVYAHLDEFVLFSDSSEALKEVITAFQNEQVMSKNDAYVNSFESLSTEASILLVTNNSRFKNVISGAVSEEYRAATKDLSFTNYPLTALQFIYSAGFAHVHATLTRSSDDKEGTNTSQTTTVHLGAELATRPVFFKNHRTNGMDIAVQDVNNILYLISPSGRIYWKKQLESRILGEIESVDLLRNGRYQLAFATQNRLHVIDRTGRVVKPFPLDFRDEITQPLAVFDYDNKRNYRFVIVQNRELYMFDNKGNRVKGFAFSKADDEITQSPKHIRIGRKDYILIPEASGKLNILSRTGKIRVPVREQLDFSENEWFEYESGFLSTNASGEMIKIDEQGKIRKEKIDLAENHKIDATEKTLVSLSENILNIKGNEITLDFGLYTAPEIFYLNNKIYVSITDNQAHKVYLFDSNGKLLPGFPVYGNSMIDLANADGDAAPELVVEGDDDAVLVYEIK